MPPAAGDKDLVGSWEQLFERVGVEEGKKVRTPIQRIEILDGYLFAFIQDDKDGKWLGGKYTVDTTKNPKWIDLDLIGTRDNKTKLYGTYEIVEGRLKVALGTTGQRVTRPLELKPDTDVLFFDVTAAKEPLGTIKFAPASNTPAKDLLPGGTIPRPAPRRPSIEKSKKPRLEVGETSAPARD